MRPGTITLSRFGARSKVHPPSSVPTCRRWRDQSREVGNNPLAKSVRMRRANLARPRIQARTPWSCLMVTRMVRWRVASKRPCLSRRFLKGSQRAPTRTWSRPSIIDIRGAGNGNMVVLNKTGKHHGSGKSDSGGTEERLFDKHAFHHKVKIISVIQKL